MLQKTNYTDDPNTNRTPLLLRGIEVADALGISRALAYRWMKNGTLPTVRVARAVRVPREALLDWIKRKTLTGGAAA